VTAGDHAGVALLARLRGEIAEDRALLARCIADLDLARARLGVTPDDPAVLALAAVALHGWYTGLETLLERVARQLDGDVPGGARWHRELLTQMAVEVPGVRAAVLPARAVAPLAELLAFRHFFRHAYGIVLDRPKITARIETLGSVVADVDAALDGLDALLDAAARAASDDD
jgi:hypothetical protein